MSDSLPPPPPSSGAWNPVGPYATSSMPMPPMRVLKGLASALAVLFAVVVLVQVAAAAARFNRANLIDEFIGSSFAGVTEQEMVDADDGVRNFLLVHFLLLVSTCVVFIIWQFRHAKNAEVLGARGGLGPGWAIGGWFVPLANYVIPMIQIFQSSKASDVAARQQGRPAKGAGLAILWGVVFGVGNIMLWAGGVITPTDNQGNFIIDSVSDIENIASTDRSAGAGHIVLALAAIIAVVLVQNLSKRQTDAYAALTTSSAPAGTDGPAPWASPSPPWGQPQPPPPAPSAPPAAMPPPPGAPPPPQ